MAFGFPQPNIPAGGPIPFGAPPPMLPGGPMPFGAPPPMAPGGVDGFFSTAGFQAAQQQQPSMQQQLLEAISPRVKQLSGLRNLDFVRTASGRIAPLVRNLSGREINELFNQQNGAFAVLQEQLRTNPQGLAQFVAQNKGKSGSAADALFDPFVQQIQNSPEYAYLKRVTGSGSGLTSRDLYQYSVNPDLPFATRLALKMRAQVKEGLVRRMRAIFQDAIKPSQADAEAQQKLEQEIAESNRRILANAGGDAESGDA